MENLTTSDITRNFLIEEINIGDTFKTNEMQNYAVDYSDNERINFSSALRTYIKSGIIEDLTPEKKRCKTYKLSKPLHGYVNSEKNSDTIKVLVEVKSLRALKEITKKYKVIEVK